MESTTAKAPHYVTDRELAQQIGVSVGFLQKDRRGPQRIPFVRLGDRILYDPPEVLQTLKASTIGGQRGRRGRSQLVSE
jgi:hypothetical protein